MDVILVAVLLLALVALVLVFVGGPLRRAPGARSGADAQATPTVGSDDDPLAQAATREQLEAAREAKYREIRDTELDYRTGKLSREDYQAIDADLRAEAIEILDRLERLESDEDALEGDEDALRPRDA